MKYPCPCCGYKTIERADTFYDLCPVCFWETDPIQLADPHYKGGANRPSLVEAQQNFILFGACEKEVFSHVRMPLADEKKDENWSPFGSDMEERHPDASGTEGSLFFKRHWNETSGDPKTDAWGTSFYYFETDKQGDVLKQMVVYDNGKILKYSNLHVEDEFGGLTDQSLDLADEEYTPLCKNAFFALWNKPIIEIFTSKKIYLPGWYIAVYDAEINSFKTTISEEKTVIEATLDHRFMLNLTYETNAKFLLEIKEGNTWIHYFNYINWEETAAATQQWIDEINEANKTVDVKKAEEEKSFYVRVSVDNQIVMSRLTTWRNMDWEVEKFRNIQIEVRDETYSIINTFTDFENMLLALQNSLPKNYQIETCFFCRFSSYFVAGNDNFGNLDCFKKCKEKFVEVNSKSKLIDLYETEKENIEQVEETYYCNEFQWIKSEDWSHKNQIK